MALFKILKGNAENLSITPKVEGYAYFCQDTHEFFIDHYEPTYQEGEDGEIIETLGELKRSKLFAASAEEILTLDEAGEVAIHLTAQDLAETAKVKWHEHTSGSIDATGDESIKTELHIHNIPDITTYNKMKDAGKIQEDHIYLVNGENEYVSFMNAQTLTEAQQEMARTNIDAVSSGELSDEIEKINTTITNTTDSLSSSINQTKIDLETKFTNANNITSGTLAAERLAISGVTAGSYGQSESLSLEHGDSFSIPLIEVDEKGRVTQASSASMSLPATIAADRVSAADTALQSGMKVTNNADWGTPMLRNVYAGTADLVAGTTALPSGVIYLVYE